jgi:hypothetical protein
MSLKTKILILLLGISSISLEICAQTVTVLNCPVDYGADYVLDSTTTPPSCVFIPINADTPLAVGIDVNSSYTLTVGFNPLSTDHDRLLDSSGHPSDWSVVYLLQGQTCDSTVDPASGNNITLDGYVTNIANYYINKDLICSAPDGFSYTLSDPRALTASILWLDFGLVPDPNRTLEIIKCKFGDPCNIDNTKKEYPLSLLTLTPSAGASPLLAGKTTALIYNYNNLTTSNTIGTPGLGGKANLPALLPGSVPVRYCFTKRDATNSVNSDFEIRPTLDFLKINWRPFIEGPSANDGLPGSLNNEKTTVIKGLDSSVLYWLGSDNVLNKR